MSDEEYEYEEDEAASLGERASEDYAYPDDPTLDRQDSAVSTSSVHPPAGGGSLVEQDVNEINDKCDDVHAGYWEAGQTINVWIAMEPSRFLLDRERSLAWGIQPDLLVCFEIKFDKFYINSTSPPVVTKAYQMTHEELQARGRVEVGFGLSWMLLDRANAFVRNDSVWPPNLATRVLDMREKYVHDLMSMFGATEEVATAALEQAKGDISDATVLLMDDSSRRRLEAQVQKAPKRPASSSAGGFVDGAFGTAQRAYQRLREIFPGASELELQNAVEASGGCQEVAEDILLDHCGSPKLLKQDSTVQEMMDEATKVRIFEQPLTEANFLLRVIHSVEDNLRTCNQRCLVCNEPVEYVGLRPVVCPKALCIMSYEELGVGLDVAAEVLRDADVMDLMVTMLYCACKAGRIELAFPDNIQVQTADRTEHSFMRQGEQDRQLLSQIVDLIPSVTDMMALAQNGNLRVHLDSLHPLLYPLLRWLISSNRAHLRRLAPEEEVKGLGTSHQFVLLTGPVERESHFQQLKAETAKNTGEGSIFAFHGSAAGNWHSILRLGLKNYSNTKYMSAGAAYGVGVYFATHMSTSLGYCTRYGASGWPHSRFGSGCTFMALCELINRPDEYTSNTDNIIVIPKEEYITTRYFLVNPNGNAHSRSLEINLVSALHYGGAGAAQEEEAKGKTKRKRGKWLGRGK